MSENDILTYHDSKNYHAQQNITAASDI